MIKLLSDKQIFASQMPDFAAARAIMAATRKILSTTRAILALTWFCHLKMYLWNLGGGAWGAPGGTPQYMKKISMSKIDFVGHLEPKKHKNLKVENEPRWPPLRYGIFPIFFLNSSLIPMHYNMNQLLTHGLNQTHTVLHFRCIYKTSNRFMA